MKQLLLAVFSFLVCTMAWGQDPELVRKAESGDKWAQCSLAQNYWYGCDGFSENRELAIKWMQKSAEQECAYAIKAMGNWYEKFDKQKAIYWFKKQMDYYYKQVEEEDEDAAEQLRKLGVTYHPGSSGYTASRSSSSSNSSSSSSSSSSGNKLLYSGTYTISNRGRSSNTGQYTDAWGSDMVCEIEVYEKSLTIKQEDEISYSYTYSGNSGSLRKYESDWGESATIYVNPVTFAMRKEVFSSFSFGGFTNTDTFVYAMTKGKTTYDYNNPSAYSSGNGGYNSNSGGYSSGGSGTTTRTYETSCLQCGGSGKCRTCNGDHRYINSLTGKYVTCPNCGTDGRCRSCGGTGKKTKTIR